MKLQPKTPECAHFTYKLLVLENPQNAHIIIQKSECLVSTLSILQGKVFPLDFITILSACVLARYSFRCVRQQSAYITIRINPLIPPRTHKLMNLLTLNDPFNSKPIVISGINTNAHLKSIIERVACAIF